MSFYDQVMRELVTAIGAALFFANALALMRRRTDARVGARRAVSRARPGSPVRPNKRGAAGRGTDLAQAPIARSVTYLVIGFVVMVWGLASLITS